MERNDKMIHLFLSAAIMIFAIAAALILHQPKEKAKKEPMKQEQINHKNKSDTESTEEVTEETETTTAEKMTEAPKDTSDWESQEAADTTPDTGEPIE